MSLTTTTKNRWHDLIWGPLPPTTSPVRRFGVKTARLFQVVLRDGTDGQIGLRAMGMVYTTLLSLVPLLAVSFSMLKAFNVHNQIEPFLLTTLAPLGEKAGEITAQILGFVSNIRVGLLGTLGLGMLIFTVISLVQKTEDAFNYIWHVAKRRTLARRFSDYLSVLLVGPLLVVTALGMTATLASNSMVQRLLAIEPFGLLFISVSKLAPYLLIIAAFTFFYMFIINTRVRFRPALVGGVVAGVAWETVGRGFTLLIANSSGNLEAVYSGFAILILFMFWLYLSWTILLFGALVAFYLQHPEHVLPNKQSPELSGLQRWKLALSVLVELARQQVHGLKPMTLENLQEQSGMPEQLVSNQLDQLEKKGYVLETADDPPTYVLAKDPSLVGIHDLISTIHRGETGFAYPSEQNCPTEVDRVLERIDQTRKQALAGMSLRDLVPTANPQIAAESVE